ncbi:MAG: type II toxin-antitoxin system Phd/YefM family antitoxin [Verrucomicrobiales bacterium]
MIYIYIMNQVSTADLRNHFRRVSAWLDNGESVEILKRGKPYATLSPIVQEGAATARSVDFAAQRKEIWNGRKFSAAEVAEMRAAEQDGEG